MKKAASQRGRLSHFRPERDRVRATPNHLNERERPAGLSSEIGSDTRYIQGYFSMDYFAHSGRLPDKSDWQPLQQHSVSVAALAAAFSRPTGLSRAAYLAGLLHDLGKYTPRFLKRLAGEDIRVDHSTAGAAHVLELAARTGQDQLMAQLIAYGILGHHAGLPDRRTDTGFDKRIARFRADGAPALDVVWRAELAADATGLWPAGFRLSDAPDKPAFQLALMGRLIFSSLVDADFKDTEAFYCALDGVQKDRDWPQLPDILPGLRSRFDAYMADLPARDSALSALRATILTHVRAKAADSPGLFTLTVPTGGGKTLTSLGFALDHAHIHGHRRIIYAIPFTSIIDQTAAIFAEALGGDIVLEHHSAIDAEPLDEQRGRQSRDKLKLAMEDWAAPVVVTTNVQFFESLFAARTSRARKLHNIAGSIIILDEAQTIPRALLMPCLRTLDELASNYGCSIVLCTATQPALDENNLKGGLPLGGRELAPDPARLWRKLRRANIVTVGDMSNADLVDALRQTEQALVIVNSRKHALELYREAQAAGLDGLTHLTTRQCAAHRRKILADVRDRLKRGLPCRVIATSLVEAGVDVDFPRVWRAEAGLDQIIQAAGRCNREGRRPLEDSVVTVFTAPDYPVPREIKGLMADMKRVRARRDDLMTLEAIEDYFGEVYWRKGAAGLDEKKIIDKFSIDPRKGAMFAYREAAEQFRMIESGMEPVVVVFDEISKKAVHDLGTRDIPSGALARRLQTYIVQLPPKAREILLRNGHAVFAHQELRGNQFAILETRSLYHEDVGLLWDDGAYLAMEDSIL
jgi:CRISPR-associated endonuclease/helicase Cas3